MDTKEFIEKAKKVHGEKYNYSKVKYVNTMTKVCIICPIHGEFLQTPNKHLSGNNCPKCSHQSYLHTTDSFIKEAKKIHGDKYDYSKVNYINSHTKVCIICKEHGEFWQTPNAHLRGKGCKSCRESHLEREIRVVLSDNNIMFLIGKHFDWLGKQHLDFYLPEYNIAIECQGEQHFIKANKFNRKKTLNEIISQDVLKNNLCKENNIKLLYYTSPLIDSLAKEKNSIYDNILFTSRNDILQKIKGYTLNCIPYF